MKKQFAEEKNFMKIRQIIFAVFAVMGLAAALLAQSFTTGAVGGAVTDPSGAAVPGATVTLLSLTQGTTATRATDSQGRYSFPLLAPGQYKITVSVHGFKTSARVVNVVLDGTSSAPFKLQLGSATQVVNVTSSTPLLQTSSANVSTHFTEQQIQNLPNPGNDITDIAQTSPGAVMNTEMGYGNFSTYGLPATSNLFTLDGQNDNDPFLNLNNSGATNLTLGQNEIASATVTNNGYSGQYGQLAGATVNYVTKSGGNQFHGDATWEWNGRSMNANDFFNNAAGAKRPFDNANQWGADFGGPIFHNKTFFFVDYEGLRVVIPTSQQAFIPSPLMETDTLANLTSQGLTNSIPFYKNIFSLYNSAPGANTAVAAGTPAGTCTAAPDPNTGAPRSFTGPGGLGTAVPCTMTFRSTAGNFTHEYLLAVRVDQNVSDNDHVFFRFQTDHGTQATYTDPINSLFNATSVQPEYQGQLSWNHVFNSTTINNLEVTDQWYSAIFNNLDPAKTLAAFPTTLLMNDGSLSNLGGENYVWPQGRNVTQFQLIDDLSKTFGNQTVKTGINFRRYDVSDQDYGFFTGGLLIPLSLDAFYNGGTDQVSTANGFNDLSVLQQSFPQSLTEPIADYQFGAYVEDDWQMQPNFKITMALRFDHNSNPVCQHNCFANFSGPFGSINHSASIPYNQTIVSGLHQAFPTEQSLLWQPRFGFTYRPFGQNTVLRGGYGLFYDAFPAGLVDNLSQNPPYDPTFQPFFDNISPGETSNLFADAAAANVGFQKGFAAGQTAAQIAAGDPLFSPPGFTTTDAQVQIPMYQEWNLAVEHQFTNNLALTLNYVGNRGQNELFLNSGLNAFCPGGCFAGLPSAAADSRFAGVTQAESIGRSNYNGLATSLQYRFSGGEITANYTYSHALDMVSNGGDLPFTTNASYGNPQNPFDPNANYGNSDYDLRHVFNANYVYRLPISSHDALLNDAIGGWTVAGTIFYHTGFPFTVVNSAATGLISSNNYGATVFANPVTGSVNCTSNAVNTPCLTAAMFTPAGSQNFFGNQMRNQYHGPNYFNTDLTLKKSFALAGENGPRLGFGFSAFNLLNHPNFYLPGHNLNQPSTFGMLTSAVSSPTSILGSFLGGDASPRLIQFSANLHF